MQNASYHTENYPTSYRELQIGKVLYRVTSVYKGEINLKKALEDLAVHRVARELACGQINEATY